MRWTNNGRQMPSLGHFCLFLMQITPAIVPSRSFPLDPENIFWSTSLPPLYYTLTITFTIFQKLVVSWGSYWTLRPHTDACLESAFVETGACG